MRFRWVLTVVFLLLLVFRAEAQTADGSPSAATALIHEVERLWSSGDKDLIDQTLRRALDIAERQAGPDHLLVADILGRLGRNEWNKREFASAEPFFRRALVIEEKSNPASFNTARLLGDLGATLRERRQYPEAETLVRRSLAIRRNLFPPDPLFVAGGLDNLARILAAQRRYAEAAGLVEESLVLRRAGLGPSHAMVRESETLLDVLRRAPNPWRIARQEGWIVLICGLGLAFLITRKIRAERRAATLSPAGVESEFVETPALHSNSKVLLDLAHLLVAMGCAGAFAYGFYLAADAWLPLLFADFGAQNLRKLSFAAGMLGFVAFFSVDSWLSNLVRRRCGLQQRFSIEDAEVRHAIRVGSLWVSGPVLIVIFGGIFSIVYVVGHFWGEPKGLLAVLAFMGCVMICIAAGWLWWSIMIPRWQVWAMRRVSDWPMLYAHAVGAQLLHRRDTRFGRLCTRTEWWTRTLRQEVEAMRRARESAAAVTPP